MRPDILTSHETAVASTGSPGLHHQRNTDIRHRLNVFYISFIVISETEDCQKDFVAANLQNEDRILNHELVCRLLGRDVFGRPEIK